MPLSIKKTKSGLIIPSSGNYLGTFSTPYMDEKIESIILEAIRDILHKKLGCSSRTAIKSMMYFLVYGNDKTTKEKIVSSVHMKITSKSLYYVKVPVNEIELEGVNLGEFVNYINTSGAKEIKSSKISFNEV